MRDEDLEKKYRERKENTIIQIDRLANLQKRPDILDVLRGIMVNYGLKRDHKRTIKNEKNNRESMNLDEKIGALNSFFVHLKSTLEFTQLDWDTVDISILKNEIEKLFISDVIKRTKWWKESIVTWLTTLTNQIYNSRIRVWLRDNLNS